MADCTCGRLYVLTKSSSSKWCASTPAPGSPPPPGALPAGATASSTSTSTCATVCVTPSASHSALRVTTRRSGDELFAGTECARRRRWKLWPQQQSDVRRGNQSRTSAACNARAYTHIQRACNAAGESNLGKSGVRGRRPSSKTLRRTRSRVDDIRLPSRVGFTRSFRALAAQKRLSSAQKRSSRRTGVRPVLPCAAPCDESRALPPLSLTPSA